MIRYLILIGAGITIFVTIMLKKNINNKKTKYVILIGPFVLGGLLYLSIFSLTKNMPPNTCDGAALFGILISYVFFCMGILFNLINILHLAIKHR